jgi:hypothetical protein
MRLFLHIGPERAATERLHRLLAGARDDLRGEGLLYPETAHAAELCMAATRPGHVDPLRHDHGCATPERQNALRDRLMEHLAQEIARHHPDTLILASAPLGQTLCEPRDVARLRDLLAPLSDDIRIVVQVDEQARALARHYGDQVLAGRGTPLTQEISLAQAEDWGEAANAIAPQAKPEAQVFPETQGAPFWLDYAALLRLWQGAFGADRVALHPLDQPVPALLRDGFGIATPLDIPAADPAMPPAAAWLARARALNRLFLQLVGAGTRVIPPRSLAQPAGRGPDRRRPDRAGRAAPDLHPVRRRQRRPDRRAPGAARRPAARPAQPEWREPDPGLGFRASQ